MTPQEYFKTNKYVVLNNVADDTICSGLTKYLLEKTKEMTDGDEQCPLSPSIYGDKLLDTLLEDLRPLFEKATGLALLPTYSYARAYRPGDDLKPHVDRKECEISATLTLGFEGDVWPINISASSDPSDDPKQVLIPVGDALVYRGMELNHWREKYTQGKWQCQVFLHYVDANGKYKDYKYDGREKLNNTKVKELTPPKALRKDYDDNFWYFGNMQHEKYLWIYKENFLSNGLIKLIEEYGKTKVDVATVGYGSGNEAINESIRKAQATGIPPEQFLWLYKMVEQEVTDINMENFKFNIDRIEHLTYIEYHGDNQDPGKYGRHTDGVIHMTRKLSFAIQLSDPDEYEGGDLLIWADGGSYKVPRKKGLIAFFPAFTEHEVTPVTKGIRKSLVGWIHGPHFA